LQIWNKDREESLLAGCTREVEQAAAEYLGMEPLGASAMFEHVYAETPAGLIKQRDSVSQLAEAS
jgi:2-oxoisovalerate dehydrogenase E1 component subunit alpha